MKIEKTASFPDSLTSTETALPTRPRESTPVGAAQYQEDTAVCKIAPSPTSDRELKVAELRRRYLEGIYEVDAGEVSTKIIDEHIEHD